MERDYLMEHVYPRLKEYCQNEYSLELQVILENYSLFLNKKKQLFLQVIDLRWGVTRQGKLFNLANDFNLMEIKKLKKQANGSYFSVCIHINIIDHEIDFL